MALAPDVTELLDALLRGTCEALGDNLVGVYPRGSLSSKAVAVAWALATLPEPWRATVERSRAWRGGATCDRDASEPEVIRFVRWAASVTEPSSRAPARHPD